MGVDRFQTEAAVSADVGVHRAQSTWQRHSGNLASSTVRVGAASSLSSAAEPVPRRSMRLRLLFLLALLALLASSSRCLSPKKSSWHKQRSGPGGTGGRGARAGGREGNGTTVVSIPDMLLPTSAPCCVYALSAHCSRGTKLSVPIVLALKREGTHRADSQVRGCRGGCCRAAVRATAILEARAASEDGKGIHVWG